MGLHSSQPRSYGSNPARVQRLAAWALLTLFCALATPTGGQTAERPVKVVVLGDSLSAGLGLPLEAAFPARLTEALKAKDIAVTIIDAGVSGDTAAGGLGRLDWSVPEGTDAVIVELGANDALRGLDPNLTKTALDTILRNLADRHIESGRWPAPERGRRRRDCGAYPAAGRGIDYPGARRAQLVIPKKWEPVFG